MVWVVMEWPEIRTPILEGLLGETPQVLCDLNFVNREWKWLLCK